MNSAAQWLFDFGGAKAEPVDGLVLVSGYQKRGQPPEEVAMMEKAASYGADAVFFEAQRNGRAPIAQAFIFASNGPADDPDFAALHKRLWSWGGVPLIYRTTPGLVQLFRCGHKPDFVSSTGEIVCRPIKQLKTAVAIASDPWWSADRLRNGTLWDDPSTCREMLSASKSAHKKLIAAVRDLNDVLNRRGVLKRHLRRRLLILSFLIAYLEERDVLRPDYFCQFRKGATKFFQVLENGNALVALLEDLEARFNGNVFVLSDEDRNTLVGSTQLGHFARLVEAHEEKNGQLTIWQLYSFRDLPIELISHVYQTFVSDSESSVYTPPFLVRLMLEEALSWERIDRLHANGEIILDPACGSGVFLVEAYKRLVLHWRNRNSWKRPRPSDLKSLLKKVHGIDIEQGAVELAAFSLCLALCDALEPEEIRASIKLFPPLAGKTLHQSCFFEAREKKTIKESVGVVVGNPPFESNLTTAGAHRSYLAYEAKHGSLPDKQLAYLFLHEAMKMVAKGGMLSMLQQYNFLYNQQSSIFRRQFIENWDVREILDFISVRGLFQKGGADTKVIVVVAHAVTPSDDRKILHATFRRTGRIDAEQGFDIDHYDMHWLSRKLVLKNDRVWRADLLGGARVLSLVDRLRSYPTIGGYAKDHEWDFGEGFIAGGSGRLVGAAHITGKKLLPSDALTSDGIDRSQITTATPKKFKSAYTARRYSPPMLLVRENMNLPHAVWEDSYLTYKAQIVGFAAPASQRGKVREMGRWLTEAKRPLQAFIAVTSPSLFSRRATAVCAEEIQELPYPRDRSLDLSANEMVVIDDMVDYYRDLIRLGEDARASSCDGIGALPSFVETFVSQVNAIYKKTPIRALKAFSWPGIVCQPFAFGDGAIDWSDADSLKGKLDALLYQKSGSSTRIARVARIYDRNFVFLLKLDRLRYWLRSTALRDADDVLADIRAQGF